MIGLEAGHQDLIRSVTHTGGDKPISDTQNLHIINRVYSHLAIVILI